MSADLRIADVKTSRRARCEEAPGGWLKRSGWRRHLDLQNISCLRRRVKRRSPTSPSTSAEHEIRAIIGPNGAGKSLDAQRDQRRVSPAGRQDHVPRRAAARWIPHQAARQGIARTFQNIALFKGMTVLDNIMTGRNLKMKQQPVQQALVDRPRPAREETGAPRKVEEIIDFLEIQHIRKTRSAACPTACRSGSSSAARWPMEPTSCCWTSRWPA